MAELLLEHRGGAGAGVPVVSCDAGDLVKPPGSKSGKSKVDHYANNGVAVEKILSVYAAFGKEVAKKFAQGLKAVMWTNLKQKQGGAGGVLFPQVLVELADPVSALACAELVWTFLEKEEYWMTGGPAEVWSELGVRVGGVDGTLQSRSRSACALEVQCVKRCRRGKLRAKKVEEKRTKVAKVVGEVLRNPRKQKREVSVIDDALICTVEVDLGDPQQKPCLSAELFDARQLQVEGSKALREWEHPWQADTDPEPPRKRQRRASQVRNGLKPPELLAAITDSDRVKSAGDRDVLLQSYVALRWTQATAVGKLREKVEFLRGQWGWTMGREVRMKQGVNGGRQAFVCKRDTLRRAHKREHGL